MLDIKSPKKSECATDSQMLWCASAFGSTSGTELAATALWSSMSCRINPTTDCIRINVNEHFTY